MTRRPSMISLFALTGLLVTGVAACSKSEPAAPADATPVAETAAMDSAPAADAATDAAPAAAPASGPASDSSGGSQGQAGGMMRGPMTKAAMLARSDERFARMDADHDGVVTTAELQAAEAGGQGGRGAGRGGGGRGMMRADADNDGRITRTEARASASERFARMDTNGDGVIGEDERPNWGGRGEQRPSN